MRYYKSFILLFFSVLILCFRASAQMAQSVSYDVSFPNRVHHEARITLTVTGIVNDPVVFWMSRSSPGRYALHEFAKNVYDVSAVDDQGHMLKITRNNPYSWAVHGSGGTVHVTYTLYGDYADGTYVGIDRTHAHINMPAAFMWAVGFDHAPIRIKFHIPENSGWKIATQLAPTSDPTTFTAPNLQYFMDSPVELSNFTMRTWQEKSGDKSYTMRLAVHHMGTEAEVTKFADMARHVVEEERGIFGELAPYDYGTYTFIADYLPWDYRDGMEHRNSSILTSPRPLAANMTNALISLAHEFFHSWNMERLRAQSIEPFDFTRVNMSKELWFGEGFTSYYDKLVLRRAGYLTDAEWAERMGRYLDVVINAPGRQFNSLVQMSELAPFEDAASSIDVRNDDNTFLSYYPWGSVVGLGLDLTLRINYHLSLDDYMKAMWEEYGRPERPYTMEDLEKTLGKITKDTAFAHQFFASYIRGTDVMNYKELLAHAGFLLRKAHPDQAVLTFGKAKLRFNGRTAEVDRNTLIGSPLYQAGIDRGDVIVSLDGRPLISRDYLETLLNGHHPGDRVEIGYLSRGKQYQTTLTLAADPTLELVPYELAGMKLSKDMKELRDQWLGSRQ